MEGVCRIVVSNMCTVIDHDGRIWEFDWTQPGPVAFPMLGDIIDAPKPEADSPTIVDKDQP